MKEYNSKFKIVQALLFLLIPIILWAINGFVLLDSISAYAKYTPMTFALSLGLSGALFMYDGFGEKNRWYNIYIGASLFGVVLFSMYDHKIIHYTFATIFFIGSLFNMVYFSSSKERWFKIITVIGVLIGMMGTFVFDWYSIFFAEWIGMLPISIHYILELTHKID